MRIVIATTVLVAALFSAPPAEAIDIFVNGKRATGLTNADLSNCQVKFDSQGNLHILSPGYDVVLDKVGKPVRVIGSSDFKGVAGQAAKPKTSYVLVYQPNAKVGFTFDIQINNKPFRKIGLQDGPFTVGLGTAFTAGANAVQVTGKPEGTPAPGGTEADVVKLLIYAGVELPDGTFKAKHPPIWQLVRAAIDRDPVHRRATVIAE